LKKSIKLADFAKINKIDQPLLKLRRWTESLKNKTINERENISTNYKG
jgi:hypothetical protein